MGKKNTYTRTETRAVKSTPMFGPSKTVTYCPSSYKMGHQSGLNIGGSGSVA